MKGLKTIIILLVGLVCLTGCGEKKLVCTKTEQDSGVNIEQKITVNFKEDKAKYVDLSVAASANDDSAKEGWTLITAILESQVNEESPAGVKVTMDKDDQNYRFKFNMEFDLSKIDNTVFLEYGLDDFGLDDSNYDGIKTSIEDDGFTCK